MCLIREDRLPPGQTLVGHHVVEYQDGGEPTRENVWVLCTKCEKLVHLMRTWATIRADQYRMEVTAG
jgi:5-methylcytosine-specific restriction endonuclease McrA